MALWIDLIVGWGGVALFVSGLVVRLCPVEGFVRWLAPYALVTGAILSGLFLLWDVVPSGESTERTKFLSVLRIIAWLPVPATIGLIIWSATRAPTGLVCLTCRSEDIRDYVRGSIYIELILWLACLAPVLFFGYSGGLLLIVALIYSIWRRSGLKKYRCGDCYSTEVIPIDTPVGMALGANAEEAAES